MSLKLLISGILTFVCAAMLCGAPDPDLFDGRFSATGSNVSGAGNDGTDESGEGSEKGESSQEGEESESGEGSESGKSSSEAASEGAAATDGEMSGSGKSGNGSSSAEATTSATGFGRSFEEFEIGASDETNGKIEINQSKDLGEPSTPASKSSSSANSNVQNSDKTAQKSDSENQETSDGSGTADFGTSVPSGL